jgi:DNA primase
VADERDEIRDRINIVDLVGQSVLLKKTGKTWKGLCPFHADKNPSFTVDPTLGNYKCWSCGEHGDVFTWVMKTRHLEFVEALHFLADLAGVKLNARGPAVSKTDKARWASAMLDAMSFFREQLQKNEVAKAYCERRGLTKEILAEWEIGYAPDAGDALASQLKSKGHALAECKELFLVDQDSVGGYFDKFRGRLMFPIKNESGDLVAFGGRLLGDGHPKYINSSDTPLYRKSKVLYGMNRAKDYLAKEKRAVLVEGYLDVIACHTAGVKSALASLGTALAEDHVRLLKRWCEQVVILYDSDAAGQKAADRAVQMIQAEGLRARIALMPEGEDPDTLLRTAGPAAVQQAVEKGLRPLEYKIQKLKATIRPDQEEFWPAAVEALAGATNAMEEDRYLVELAAMFPGATDQFRMQKALKEDVRRFRSQKRTAREDLPPPPRPQNPFTRTPLNGAEIAVFRALQEAALRQAAWNLCGESDLFVTDLARNLGHAIRETFPDGPPTEKPAVWIPKIEPEHLREAFIDAQDDPRVARFGADVLEGAVATLRRLKEKRDLRQSKSELSGDDRLRDIHKKLRNSQGLDNLDAI